MLDSFEFILFDSDQAVDDFFSFTTSGYISDRVFAQVCDCDLQIIHVTIFDWT